MTRNRFALAACFSALVFSCCTTARAQSTLTWDDLAKGVSATQDRSDALYRAWDPVAFQSFEGGVAVSRKHSQSELFQGPLQVNQAATRVAWPALRSRTSSP